MEQIGVISEFKVRSDGHIVVDFPPYSWLHDDIYYYAVPRIRKESKEILLSLVDPQEWHHTWEIMFNIDLDRPGIIFELTQLLAEKAINIIKQEGLTPSEELQYSFWVLVKLTDYTEREHLNGSTKEEIGEYLKNDLNTSLKNRDIHGIEAIGFKEIELLYENHHAKVTTKLNSIHRTHLTTFSKLVLASGLKNIAVRFRPTVCSLRWNSTPLVAKGFTAPFFPISLKRTFSSYGSSSLTKK